MIKVTDVTGKEKYVNASLLEGMELIPDTRLVFVNGHSMIVRESPEEVVKRVISFRRQWLRSSQNISSMIPVLKHEDLPPDDTPGAGSEGPKQG